MHRIEGGEWAFVMIGELKSSEYFLQTIAIDNDLQYTGKCTVFARSHIVFMLPSLIRTICLTERTIHDKASESAFLDRAVGHNGD
jgi:hypothetical protein